MLSCNSNEMALPLNKLPKLSIGCDGKPFDPVQRKTHVETILNGLRLGGQNAPNGNPANNGFGGFPINNGLGGFKFPQKGQTQPIGCDGKPFNPVQREKQVDVILDGLKLKKN